MIEKLKNIFRKKNETKTAKKRAIQSMASDVIAKPKTAVQLANEKIIAERLKRHNEKVEETGKRFTDRLNEHLNSYFNNFSEDEETNEFAYDLLNKEWRSYVQKVNTFQKLLQLKSDCFETEVARIVSENPQFQKKVIDLTKLNEVI